jgi:hypothetical protein
VQIGIISIKYFISIHFSTALGRRIFPIRPPSMWNINGNLRILHELLILDRIKRYLLEVVLHDLPCVLGLLWLLVLSILRLINILSLNRRHSVELILLLRLYLTWLVYGQLILVVRLCLVVFMLLAGFGFYLHSIVLTQHLMLDITHRDYLVC